MAVSVENGLAPLNWVRGKNPIFLHGSDEPLRTDSVLWRESLHTSSRASSFPGITEGPSLRTGALQSDVGMKLDRGRWSGAVTSQLEVKEVSNSSPRQDENYRSQPLRDLRIKMMLWCHFLGIAALKCVFFKLADAQKTFEAFYSLIYSIIC